MIYGQETGWRRLPIAGTANEALAIDDVADVAPDLGGGHQDAGTSIRHVRIAGRLAGGRGAVHGHGAVAAAAAAVVHAIVHGGCAGGHCQFAGEHRAWHASRCWCVECWVC